MSEGRPVYESIARFAATSTRPARADAWNVGERPAHGLEAPPVGCERDAKASFADGAPAAVPLEAAEAEEGLRILLAVRLEALEGAREGVVRLGGLDFGVDEEPLGPLLLVARRAKAARRSSRNASKDAAGRVRPSAEAWPPNSFV